MSDDDDYSVPVSDDTRPYVCTSCGCVVGANWNGPGGFSISCDCTSVPVVPQMGQPETPDNWVVYREECCRDVDVTDLESSYGDRHEDFHCPDCGAGYSWDGSMVSAPDSTGGGDLEIDSDQETLV